MESIKQIVDSASSEGLKAEADRCALKREEIAAEEPLKPVIKGTVEVTRSFSYKLNVGNYESRDFFCSQKIECDATDAEALSEQVHEFCLKQVRLAVAAYMKAREEQRSAHNS